MSKSPRIAIRLSLDQEVMAEAKKLELNLSAIVEASLSKAIAARKAEMWLEENREAIDENNRYFAEHGLAFAELRGGW